MLSLREFTFIPSAFDSSSSSLWQIQDLADSDESGHRKLAKYTLKVIPNDQKDILSRRVQGGKAHRKRQPWVLNNQPFILFFFFF